jgi:hypothetical protein
MLTSGDKVGGGVEYMKGQAVRYAEENRAVSFLFYSWGLCTGTVSRMTDSVVLQSV